MALNDASLNESVINTDSSQTVGNSYALFDIQHITILGVGYDSSYVSSRVIFDIQPATIIGSFSGIALFDLEPIDIIGEFTSRVGTFSSQFNIEPIYIHSYGNISGLFGAVFYIQEATLYGKGAGSALFNINPSEIIGLFTQPVGVFTALFDNEPASIYGIFNENGGFYGLFNIESSDIYSHVAGSAIFDVQDILIFGLFSSLSEDETTYAINLQTNAVTQITLGNLKKIVAAHGRVYGLTTDGTLLRLAGSPETSMNASFRLAPSAIGANHPIRLRDIYLMARDTRAISISVVQNETVSQPYLGVSNGVSDLCTHKVKPGRGPVLTTTGLQVNNVDGGSLDVASIEILFDTLSRRIR